MGLLLLRCSTRPTIDDVTGWLEDFDGERYAITVSGGDVTIGYDGKVVGAGTWDGTCLHLTFSRIHFYGEAGKDADPAFLSELRKRIAVRLGSG